MVKIFSARERLSLYMKLYRISSLSALGISIRPARWSHSTTMRRPSLDISRGERGVCSKSSSMSTGGVGDVSTSSLPFYLEKSNQVHWLVIINNKNTSGLNSCKLGWEILVRNSRSGSTCTLFPHSCGVGSPTIQSRYANIAMFINYQYNKFLNK